MGIILSDENECECLTSSRSRETSLSDEGIMICSLVCVQPKMVVLRWEWERVELRARELNWGIQLRVSIVKCYQRSSAGYIIVRDIVEGGSVGKWTGDAGRAVC
jgi:hypothetical protein